MGSDNRHIRIDIGSTPIGDPDSLVEVIPWLGAWILTKVYYTDQDGIAESDVNYAGFTVEQGATAASLSTVAAKTSQTTGEADGLGTLAADTPIELEFDNSTAQDVNQGEVVKVSISKTGTGVVTNGSFMLVYEQGR